MMKYRIGIDLGGTKLAGGIVDDSYEIITKLSMPTKRKGNAEQIIVDIIHIVNTMIKNQGITMNDIVSVGIGVPGTANLETGCIEFANNLAFEYVPITKILEERLLKKVYFDNDGNAAAYGEYLAGVGRGTGCESLVAVTLGTGIGGGMILNGEIFRGNNYGAAEIGHMVINFDGISCNCGRKGCFEAYASATALVEQTKAAMAGCLSSSLWEMCDNDLKKINGKVLFEAVRCQDKTALDILKTYLSYLSVGIVNIINLLQPDILCIGGGIGLAGDLILVPLSELVEREVYTRGAKKQTKLCIAERGNDAGIIGAAFLHGSYGQSN